MMKEDPSWANNDRSWVVGKCRRCWVGSGFTLLCLLLCMFENLCNRIFKKRGQERTPFSIALVTIAFGEHVL